MKRRQKGEDALVRMSDFILIFLLMFCICVANKYEMAIHAVTSFKMTVCLLQKICMSIEQVYCCVYCSYL